MYRRRSITVLRRHLGELTILPDFDDEIGPGVEHPGEADDEYPNHRGDADQIMHVEPAHNARAAAAISPEPELAHRGRIDDHA